MSIRGVLVWACLTAAAAQDTNRTGKYRLRVDKTYGDDHLCLTEVEFYDANAKRLVPTFVSMSSCYGCSSCNGCVHRYGNPNVLFDGVADSNSPAAWVCTAPGTFTDGIGSQQIVFKMDDAPTVYVLQRAQANGDWVTRDYGLEAEMSDGSWVVLDTAVDAPKRADQKRNVTGEPVALAVQAIPNPPWSYDKPDDWANAYPSCAGSFQSPIDLNLISEETSKGDNKLPFKHSPMARRALGNTGKGLQVAGLVGNMTLPGGVYLANQFNFHFPAEHRIGGDDHLAVGELHIVLQKVGATGADDIAIIAIMLHLPQENEALNAQEQFFIDMGMLAIPDEGEFGSPLSAPIDFSILNGMLQSNYWQYTGSLTTPPCTEGVEWFVMEQHAHISGVVVQQFKAKFPNPMNARPIQSTNGRIVSVNGLPAAPTVSS